MQLSLVRQYELLSNRTRSIRILPFEKTTENQRENLVSYSTKSVFSSAFAMVFSGKFKCCSVRMLKQRKIIEIEGEMSEYEHIIKGIDLQGPEACKAYSQLNKTDMTVYNQPITVKTLDKCVYMLISAQDLNLFLK
ncbi:Hypothetical_protein [Hexamita inflata]|uniref:Hypothetical_protein n=1 Tax=Hexamita inflata TaxID=28002 RepID=A0AA86PU18_9EUKA|nr:Hypothetical protein HINF_LOCUS27658 [Hexamita inflata]CAI9944963.1 Hypothetical protein HINF_LOCUS32608 [Hexamita inflata]